MAKRSASVLQQTHVQGDQLLGDRLVEPTQESNTWDKPSPSVLGTHVIFLSQQVDSKEPHQHQSFSKRYQPASSSTPSNSCLLSQDRSYPSQLWPLTAAMSSKHLPTCNATTVHCTFLKETQRLLAFFPCSLYYPAPMHVFLKHWSRSALLHLHQM